PRSHPFHGQGFAVVPVGANGLQPPTAPARVRELELHDGWGRRDLQTDLHRVRGVGWNGDGVAHAVRADPGLRRAPAGKSRGLDARARQARDDGDERPTQTHTHSKAADHPRQSPCTPQNAQARNRPWRRHDPRDRPYQLFGPGGAISSSYRLGFAGGPAWAGAVSKGTGVDYTTGRSAVDTVV